MPPCEGYGVHWAFGTRHVRMRLREVVAAENQKIYAQCVNDSGSKTFFAAGNKEMWQRMQTQPRHYSEVIADAPCHLFLDFDHGDVHAQWQALEPMLSKVLDAMNLEYTHVLLDSSSDTKQSLHVVTRCNKFLLQSPTQGAEFLQRVSIYYDAVIGADMAVYSRNRCFRMLGSSKFNMQRPLKGAWTYEHWQSTLVQPLEELPVMQWSASAPALTPRTLTPTLVPPCVQHAMKWLRVVDIQVKYELRWCWVGHLEVGVHRCPFAGRVHRHNHMYVVLQLGKPVRFACHGCKKFQHRELPLPLRSEINLFLNTVI